MNKILIIEDDAGIAASLEIRFKAKGYITLVANDALQGTRLAVQNGPDLIVLDISLPAGNGLTLAANLKKLPETQNTPIIFITARKDPDLRQKVADLKVAGLFEKPYDIEELLALARRALDQPGSASASSHPPTKDSKSWTKTRAERVLVIEDDPKIGMALALRLKAAGYEANLSPDALLGLNAAVRTSPDLVLLDISMPGGNGLDLGEKIQKLIPHPPHIIFLTASKNPALREKSRALGAAGFFEKPYEAEDLMTAIEEALFQRRQTTKRIPA